MDRDLRHKNKEETITVGCMTVTEWISATLRAEVQPRWGRALIDNDAGALGL